MNQAVEIMDLGLWLCGAVPRNARARIGLLPVMDGLK
jgi:hypothetical protein